jgi:hypothetical protein
LDHAAQLSALAAQYEIIQKRGLKIWHSCSLFGFLIEGKKMQHGSRFNGL